jgi:2-dehydropantoate 2-reductase
MSENRPQIGILGMGAVGQFIGAALSSHADVCWFVREASSLPASLSIVGFREWSVAAPHCVSLGSVDAAQRAARLEALIVCVREHQLASVSDKLKEFPITLPLLFAQNGLGILDAAIGARIENPDRLIRMLCRFGVMRESASTTRLSGPYGVTLTPRNSSAEKLGALLSKANFDVAWAASVQEAEWQKAILNIFVNPVCTLAGTPNRGILEDSALRASAMALVDEAIMVARSDGIDLSEWTEQRLSEAVQPFRENINSLLVGLREGLPSDMNMLLGEVERRAEKHRIAVPRINEISQKLAALFASRP